MSPACLQQPFSGALYSRVAAAAAADDDDDDVAFVIDS